MRIDRPLQQDIAQSLTRDDGHNPSPLHNEDANFFSSLMEPPASRGSAAPTTGVMTEALNQLGKSTSEMKRGLKAFNSDFNEKARLGYSSHLSDTVLMTQMLVKSVGKSAQFVEKISNLQ